MKRFNRILCAALALVLCLGMMAGCSSAGDVVMELEGQSITANMYAFWLSRYKAFFVYYYMSNAEDTTMWDTVVDDSGRTINEIFTGYVKDNARTYVAALHLYDEYGLKISDSVKKTLASDMETLIEEAGGKTVLNGELANYAVNCDMLEEIYIIEEKVAQLQSYMFSEGGPHELTDAQKDAYYQENYARIKHIFVSTADRYVTDENGEYVVDENGNAATVALNDEELAAKKAKAEEVVSKLNAGEDFDTLLATYTEDTATSVYPGGYYFTRNSSYVEEVIDTTFEMGIGEWRCIESDLGYHIVKRLALEEKGYDSADNEDFFTDFTDNLTVERFTEILTPYMEQVVVYDEIADLYSLKSVNANYDY